MLWDPFQNTRKINVFIWFWMTPLLSMSWSVLLNKYQGERKISQRSFLSVYKHLNVTSLSEIGSFRQCKVKAFGHFKDSFLKKPKCSSRRYFKFWISTELCMSFGLTCHPYLLSSDHLCSPCFWFQFTWTGCYRKTWLYKSLTRKVKNVSQNSDMELKITKDLKSFCNLHIFQDCQSLYQPKS